MIVRTLAATLSVLSLVLAPGCTDSGADPECSGEKCDDLANQEFDYVIVGAGAGGGPLAARLARKGHKVLLLEAGEDPLELGHELLYKIPLIGLVAAEESDISFGHIVKHYTDLDRHASDNLVRDDGGNAQGILYPRGNALGGSTAVNENVAVYAHRSDWENMVELTGDDSWSAENMRRYWETLERKRHAGANDPDTEGWLQTETHIPWGSLAGNLPSVLTTLFPILHAAAIEGKDGQFLGLFTAILSLLEQADINKDVPDEDRKGFYAMPYATKDGARNSVRELILDTILEGHPLTLKTRALVTNVVFAGEPDASGACDELCRTAIGVDYIEGAKLHRANAQADPGGSLPDKQRVLANREVILSAGAFNTPQLLMQSGIGPAAELAAHKIPLRANLPVGENLQDRYEVAVTYKTDRMEFAEGCRGDVTRADEDPCITEWQKTGKGLMAASPMVLLQETPQAKRRGIPSDLVVFGGPGFFKGFIPGYGKKILGDPSLFTWGLLKSRTENRSGTVTLGSRVGEPADPRDAPLANFRFFGDLPEDFLLDNFDNIDRADDDRTPHLNDLQAVVDGVESISRIGRKADELMTPGFNGRSFKQDTPRPDAVGFNLDESPEQDPAGSERRRNIARWAMRGAWGHHACCSNAIGDGETGVLNGDFQVRNTKNLRVVDASVFPRIPGFFIVVPTYLISEKAADVIHEHAMQQPQ